MQKPPIIPRGRGLRSLGVAILLVKVNVGLNAPPQQGAGAELDLALIAGVLVILFAGPGSVSLDRTLGIEEGVAQSSAPRRVRRK